MSDPQSDPRLKIPEVLREPVAKAKPARSDSGMWGMAKAWGTALDFIFTIIAGALLGYGFDRWKGTAPTGLMVGLALGFVVAFIRIVRSTLRQEREETRRKAQQRGK
ncbi:MAG TPA: AtpZ/AtpI family protein [Phycisphaerales bacterium]|nr:AtpZ/AtpI family protein [Phycisphaerales bacterium]